MSCINLISNNANQTLATKKETQQILGVWLTSWPCRHMRNVFPGRSQLHLWCNIPQFSGGLCAHAGSSDHAYSQ